MLAAQDPKITYALGSTGPEPCQPGPLVVRGITAGQLGLALARLPVGNLNMDLEGHKVLRMSLGLFHKACSIFQLLYWVKAYLLNIAAPVPTVASYWKLTFQDHGLEELQGYIAPLVS